MLGSVHLTIPAGAPSIITAPASNEHHIFGAVTAPGVGRYALMLSEQNPASDGRFFFLPVL